MKKFWISLIGLWFFVMSSSAFAASLTTWQIDEFNKKLDNNRVQLLKNLDDSKQKLESTAKENSAITETSLFKAASCLWAISEEDQDLDFNKLVSWLQETIINEYIKLDWDIKRLNYGLTSEDPIVFWNTLDTYYNQNAQKISDLEKDYYVKATKAKENFLAYVENNKDLLNWLAVKLDAFELIQNSANNATKALDAFSWAINKVSTLLKDLEKAREEVEAQYEAQLDKIIAETIAKYQPSWEVQAQYYVNKENYMAKFRTEIKKAEFYLFSGIFDYEKYENLLEKKANIDNQFLGSDKNLDCSLLLTTSFNITRYTEWVQESSNAIIEWLNLLTDAIEDERINMSILETPSVTYFQKDAEKLIRNSARKFRNMLESISPVQETTTWDVVEETNSAAESTPAVVSVTFTQAFKKNQYHEQVKTLQTVLKNWWYYNGEITGVYSPATIEAVYHFQLKEGIITGNEKDKSAYGWFGTATRARMNALLQ